MREENLEMVRKTFHTKTVGSLNEGYFGLTI